MNADIYRRAGEDIRRQDDLGRQERDNAARLDAWRTRRWYHQTLGDTPPLVLTRCTVPTDWPRIAGWAFDIVVTVLITTAVALTVVNHWG